MRGLYALPPGADFATAFVEGLLARLTDAPPEALARVTIHANSGRTLSALRAAFEARGPLLLPRLTLLAEAGAETPGDIRLPPPAAPLARRMELARLVEALARTQAQGQHIPELTASLAELMAEMQSEGLGPDALDRIDAAEHAAHWQRALAFLRIAAGFHLSGPPVDREARQRLMAERRAAAWARGEGLPEGPVIVAGSTGSHGATRLFMEAVARLPQGAVVLPGFDFDQPDAIWAQLSAPDARHSPDDHPQARLAPLVAALGRPRPWVDAAAPSSAPDPARNRLMSLALRPAPVTDQWIADGPSLGDLRPATARLSLIEADTPATEAAAIALIIRDAVERGEPVTLMAADRMLTRRVAAALDRWRLIPDDSAGRPLPLTAAGLFLRHVAGLFGQALTLDLLLIVLKHPLTATGGGADARRSHLRQTRELELHLRRHGPAFPDGPALRAWGGMRDDPARRLWAEWVARMLDRITPLAADRAPRPLADRLSDHRALAEALADGPARDDNGGAEAAPHAPASRLWEEAPGELARAVLDHLAAYAHLGPALTAGDYAELLHQQLQAQAVREDAVSHPLIRFRGPREARTEAVGLVILAGLNEGGWPQALPPDPWLSRQMRRQAGLTVPERRIGLAAHDFQIAMGAAEIILTRARRDADAETIPSRWLNRLLNLTAGLRDGHGPEALAAMRAHGQRWLDLAAALAEPATRVPPAPRPAPIPPPGALRDLSVTGVKTLIRDPYAIYARKVLRLNPLDPLRAAPDAAERGTVLHRIVQEFLTPPPSPLDSVETLTARLMEVTDRVLAEDVPWPAARAFWRTRIADIAARLMADERARLQRGAPAVIERRGEVDLPGLGVRLTAKPDRIERHHDGSAFVYDYKSGKPPSDKEIAAFDKQLPLEAAMIARGAFGDLGPVTGAAYIQLGGEGATQPRACDDALVAETWDRFVTLIAAYVAGGRGFTARAAMQKSDDRSDYDHLARFGEWSESDLPQPRKVGHD